jgi:hypothetical protein
MVAVVNKQVILESELDQATRVEFLLQSKPIEQMAQPDRIAALERLIDRALLEQQIVDPAMLNPSAEDLAAKIKEVREGLPGAGSDERWKAILGGYGLTQQDVEDQLTSQFRILRFIDLRFRGLVQVDKDAINAYYQDRFLPEVRKRNVPEPKLSEVSDRIEQILAEQRIDGLLNNWLKTLRAQAHIERMLPGAAPANAGTTP